MPSMKECYETETRGRDPRTIDRLFLDNADSGKIEGIDLPLTNLVSLSLVNCKLTSFRGLPPLEALKNLDASNNLLGDDPAFDILVKNCPELERLVLSDNKFCSIEVFRPLKMAEKLIDIDISSNESLGLTEEYREKLFEMLPNLKVLDGFDSAGNEIEEEFVGEGGEDSGDDSENGEDEDGPGISYLNRSQFSDDETDDYEPKGDTEEEEGEEGDDEEEEEDEVEEKTEASRGTKRPASQADEEGGDETNEPESKKSASDE